MSDKKHAEYLRGRAARIRETARKERQCAALLVGLGNTDSAAGFLVRASGDEEVARRLLEYAVELEAKS